MVHASAQKYLNEDLPFMLFVTVYKSVVTRQTRVE